MQRSVLLSGLVGGLGKLLGVGVASAEKSVGVSDWGREGKDELSTWWEWNMKGEKSHSAFGEEVSHCHCSNQGAPKVPVPSCMYA